MVTFSKNIYQCRSNTVSEQHRALRKVNKINVTQIENGLLSNLQEKTSSWKKLKRLMVIILVVSEILLKRLLEDYHSFLSISAGGKYCWRWGWGWGIPSAQRVIIRTWGEFCLGCIIKNSRFNLTLKCIFQFSKHNEFKSFPW